MTDEIKNGHAASHGDYERRDLSGKSIVYFLVILGVATILAHFLLAGLYDFLDKRERASQPAVSPLATNVPTDTRQIPAEYKGDYEEYLKKNFPAPQLETDERQQLNGIRLGEEETLNSYGWVNQQAGTVHIPIERAMEILAARGLPVNGQSANSVSASSENKPVTPGKEKGNKK